jgi:hypothetical protein
VYTHADVQARFDEAFAVLRSFRYEAYTPAVRIICHPIIMGAYHRVNWAMPIVYDCLIAMDAQSAGETDTEA